MSHVRLKRDFFERNTVDVAQELLGKVLVFHSVNYIITETEAYRGADDEASHAARGPTLRSKIMYGKPGFTYVYLIYGVYHCLNFVTEAEGDPGAVLIRGARMLENPQLHLDGPGKLCRELGITRQHNNIDLVNSGSFYIVDAGLNPAFEITPRIGITKAIEKPWRFVSF